MKRKILGGSSYKVSRQEMMDQISELMNERVDMYDTFETILLSHGADTDDTDPKEGFFHTMSDADMSSALNTMKSEMFRRDIEESGLVDDLDEILGTIGDLQDSYFNDDAFFATLVSCHTYVLKAKTQLDRSLQST